LISILDSLQDIGFSFVLVDSFTGGQLVDGCMNIGQKLYFFPAWLQIRGGILGNGDAHKYINNFVSDVLAF